MCPDKQFVSLSSLLPELVAQEVFRLALSSSGFPLGRVIGAAQGFHPLT